MYFLMFLVFNVFYCLCEARLISCLLNGSTQINLPRHSLNIGQTENNSDICWQGLELQSLLVFCQINLHRGAIKEKLFRMFTKTFQSPFGAKAVRKKDNNQDKSRFTLSQNAALQ